MIKVANYDIYTNNKNKFYKMKLAVFKKEKMVLRTLIVCVTYFLLDWRLKFHRASFEFRIWFRIFKKKKPSINFLEKETIKMLYLRSRFKSNFEVFII